MYMNKQKIMTVALYTYLLVMLGLSVAFPQHQTAITLVVLSFALLDVGAIKYVDKSKLSWLQKKSSVVEEELEQHDGLFDDEA